MFKIKNRKNPPAYIALISLILIASFVLILTINLTYLNISGLKAISAQELSNESFYNADSCLEEAVLKLKRDTSYTGGSINLDLVNCNVSVTPSGSQKILTITGTSGIYTRKIQTTVTLTTAGTAVSASTSDWKEI